MRLILVSTVVLGALALPSRAFACGGLFCNQAAPVDQAAERIVFSFDGEMLDTEVQISFSGQSDDFAWIVPVPSEPELYVSNDGFFTQLANATVPVFNPSSDSMGGLSFGCADYSVASTDAGGMKDGYGRVNVVSEATVGPYDTVVLQASSAGVLLDWLAEQGYSLPDALEGTLAPYVAADQYFVALKLSSGQDTGDLAPLGMRYAATAASIPIQLTAVAAQDDLPIEVFVLGPSRAVPDNYLHVQLNMAAIDWYNQGTNYRDVVARAADEAGGQAFVTDFAGPTGNLGVTVWFDGMVDTATLATTRDPITWLESIVYSSVPTSSQLTALLLRFVPAPSGVDESAFLSCPSCYADQVDLPDFDPAAATTALNEEVLAVLQDEQARLDRATTLTRLFTTMSPDEMTADPIFVFNADIEQDVSQYPTATDHINRSLTGDMNSRTFELEDGREYKFPDPNDPDLSSVDTPAALIIEDLGAEGEGTVLFDGTDDAKAAAIAFSGGCSSEAAAGFLPFLLLGAGVARRRRA